MIDAISTDPAAVDALWRAFSECTDGTIPLHRGPYAGCHIPLDSIAEAISEDEYPAAGDYLPGIVITLDMQTTDPEVVAAYEIPAHHRYGSFVGWRSRKHQRQDADDDTLDSELDF